VAEVAARTEYRAFDAVVNVQGDEPFVEAAAVRGAAGLVADGRFPLGTAGVPADEGILKRPDIVKLVAADDGRAMYFSRAPIPFLRDPDDRDVLRGRVMQHIGVYAYRRDALARWVALAPHPLERIERLEQLRPLAAGIAMGVSVVAEAPRGGIDTEDDLRRANAQWDDFLAGRT
jgi:3-deoxy-manno-octulosonate cytidylyltransferase (CMP-KDO synthetase)